VTAERALLIILFPLAFGGLAGVIYLYWRQYWSTAARRRDKAFLDAKNYTVEQRHADKLEARARRPE